MTFEGSHGNLDWWRNLQFKKVKIDKGVKMHKGFYLQLKEVLKIVTQEILDYPKQDKLIITGHSQGAVLAIGLIYYLSSEIIELYGKPILAPDAPPRVGNKKFINIVMSKVSQCRWYVNGADSVVKVPFALPTVKFLWTMSKNPYWMNYRHMPTKIKIGQKLSLKEVLLYIPRKIIGNPMDHKPQRYLINKRKFSKKAKK